MPDNPVVVQLLREYAFEASITRPEVGMILGQTVGQMAGIHNRNTRVIGTWPILDPKRKSNRRCQFPLGTPGSEDFHLCGDVRADDDLLLCKKHRGMKW